MTIDGLINGLMRLKEQGIPGTTTVLREEIAEHITVGMEIYGLQPEEVTYSSSLHGFPVNKSGIPKAGGKRIILI